MGATEYIQEPVGYSNPQQTQKHLDSFELEFRKNHLSICYNKSHKMALLDNFRQSKRS